MSAVTDTTTSAKQIAGGIAALPPLPATAQEILTCFGDEFIDANKVTAVVEGDPGICAKLLGLANSAYFGLAEPVTSMGEAISRVLGVDTVRSLVLAMAIQQSFNSRKCPGFEAQRFWMQSLMTAECCKRIAISDQNTPDEIRDLAYSAGLCHNLGLMALAHMEPQRTDTVLQAKKLDGAGSLSSLFVREFATDHKTMTAELARFWSLPEPMTEAYEQRAVSALPKEGSLATVLSAAELAVQHADDEADDIDGFDDIASALGMTATELRDMAKIGERQRNRVRSLASNMTG